MSAFIRITGVEEINNLLKNLSDDVKEDVINEALSNVAKEILKKAEENVWEHQHTGRVYRSLGISTRKKNGKIKDITVGARAFGKYKGHLAHLLEAGSDERFYTTKNGIQKSTGRMKATNFWSNANEDSEDIMEKELTDNIIKNMEKVVNKYNKKLK